jgi:WD40 repeat protein
MRLPDPVMIEGRFVPALFLEDEPRAVTRLLELAANVRREDAPTLGMCPYKGLDYFDEADADLFVGREKLTEKLAERVLALVSKDKAGNSRFFAIVGASGSGKSSIVRAGLVPALRWNKTSANWPIYVLTPSVHPLESLANVMAREPSLVTTATLMDNLAREPRTLGMHCRRVLKTTGGSYLLLVIDQFEELFALCQSEEERSAFIANLIGASNDDGGGAVVVITLRADFYSYCAKYMQLREVMATNQEYIGAMSDEEMQRAIEEPAQRGRWEFESGLVDLILHDVGHEPGALPLLSHALLETWHRRHGRIMTLSGYASAGGVRGAIAETAEAVCKDQFSPHQQEIARRIFIRLTELGDETSTGDTRRRANFNELILKPEDADATQIVLKALADARLITTSEDSVQVAHEALIREWPTLRGWLEDNREGLRLHRQLTEATQEWIGAECEADNLFRGARLAQAREWSVTHSDDMNAQEQEFLAASIASSEREAAEREAQNQRELEAARKLAEAERRRAEEESQSTEKLRRRAISLSLALVMAFILIGVSIFLARQATQNASLAVAQKSTADAASVLANNESDGHATAEAIAKTRQLVADAASTQAISEAHIRATTEAHAEAESDLNYSLIMAAEAQSVNKGGLGDLALLLALESVKISQPSPGALSALRSIATGFGTRAVLSGHSHAVQSVAFSPDTKTAFSGSCANLDTQGVCQSGELILWDLNGMKEVRRWSAHSTWVTAVAFSLDGQTLISGARDGSLILWDINGEHPWELTGHTASISDLAIVPGDGSLLSGSMDGSLILWDITTAQATMLFEPTSNPITAIAVAASAPVAVSAHQDGSLILWDLENPKHLRRFEAARVSIKSVAITPDASQVIFDTSTPPDMFLRIIDGYSGDLITEKMFGGMPGDLVLSPDLRNILMACTTGIFQIDLTNLNILESSLDPPDILNAVAISQDGHLGLSASQDGTIRIWNLSEQQDNQTINIPADILTAIAINSDGKYLILNDASRNGFDQPVLWDIAKREVVRTYPGYYAAVSPGAVAISPDDRFVAAAGFWKDSGAPIVMIWDQDSGELMCDLKGFTENGRAVAFSPDSSYLLAGSQVPNGITGHLILWDVQTCQQVRRFEANVEVTSIAFSRDGTRAITGTSQLGRAFLWDVATGKEIKSFPYADYGPVLGVAFGPGDTTLLGTGAGELYLWDINTTKVIRRYTGIPSIPYSVAISPDGKYVLSGFVNGEVVLWDFDTGEQLSRLNLNNIVFSVGFSPDGKTAFASSQDGTLLELVIVEKSLPEMLEWIKENRYVRELTLEEMEQYRVEP